MANQIATGVRDMLTENADGDLELKPSSDQQGTVGPGPSRRKVLDSHPYALHLGFESAGAHLRPADLRRRRRLGTGRRSGRPIIRHLRAGRGPVLPEMRRSGGSIREQRDLFSVHAIESRGIELCAAVPAGQLRSVCGCSMRRESGCVVLGRCVHKSCG